jgi:hypothetical protein
MATTSFDPEKDELIREVDHLEISSNLSLVIELRRYNGGPTKVAVQRVGTKQNGETYFRAMGRLTLDESEWLAGALKRAK